MSKDKIRTNITKRIAGPVKTLRWNVVSGTFVLQMAKEAVVFQDNKFLRMETVWQDVPIVDNADNLEPAPDEHITTAKLLES